VAENLPTAKEVASSNMLAQPYDVKIDVNSMAKAIQNFEECTDFMKSPIAMLAEMHILWRRYLFD
jgi:hypothetical protein